MECLKKEVSRLSAVKALTMIAGSPLKVNLNPIINEVVPVLGSFLRKNQRALKLNSLALLDTLVKNYSFDPQLLRGALAEVQPLLSESDLHVAQLSLVLLTSSAKLQPQALVGIHEKILPEIMNLVRSPLLQGTALKYTLEFFQALVQANLPGLGYRDILKMLMVPFSGINPPTGHRLHKQAYHSLANRVAQFTLQVQNESISVTLQLLLNIQKSILDCFSETVKRG